MCYTFAEMALSFGLGMVVSAILGYLITHSKN